MDEGDLLRGGLLNQAQQDRFVELMKKHGALLPESRWLCMVCGVEVYELEVAKGDDPEFTPCDCGLSAKKRPEGTIRFG